MRQAANLKNRLATNRKTVRLVISIAIIQTGRRKTLIKIIPTKNSAQRKRLTVYLTRLVSMVALTAFLNGIFVPPRNTRRSARTRKEKLLILKQPLLTCVIFRENHRVLLAKTSKLIRTSAVLDARVLSNLLLLMWANANVSSFRTTKNTKVVYLT